MLKACHVVLWLALLLVTLGDSSLAQSASRQNKGNQPTQPPATDQRGTDQVPFTVKILPTQKPKEETDKEDRGREEKTEIDRKLAFETQRIADYTWWLASVTFFLFCVAITQAGLFIWQLILIKRALRPAEKAAKAAQETAEAAKLNAQAVIDAERARIFVKVKQDNTDSVRGLVRYVQTPGIKDELVTTHMAVGYTLKNYGKTPAIIKEIAHDITHAVEPPSKEGHHYTPVVPLFIDHILEAGNPSQDIGCGMDERLTVGQAKSIQESKSSLWFHGYVSYDDTFGWGRELRYIFYYNGDTGGSFRLYSYREFETKLSDSKN